MIDLSCLVEIISGSPLYQDLLDAVRGRSAVCSANVHHAAQPYLVSALYRDLNSPVLVVVPGDPEARSFCEQCRVWLGRQSDVFVFPKPVSLAHEESILDPYTEQQRLRAMSALWHAQRPGGIPPLVVSSAAALVRKIAAHEDFATASQTISAGMAISPTSLLSRWTSMGYRREAVVEAPGAMSVHGGNIDIFPFNSTEPARIEFLGNQVESIRLFDPRTQLSTGRVPEVEICRAGGTPTDSLVSYLPEGSLLVLVDISDIETSLREMYEQTEQTDKTPHAAGESGTRAGDAAQFELEELTGEFEGAQRRLYVGRWSTDQSSAIAFPFTSAPSYPGRQRQLLEEILGLLNGGARTVIVSRQAARLSEILQQEGHPVSPLSGIDFLPSGGSLTLIDGSLPEGWVLGADLVLFTDAEIFGFVKQAARAKSRAVPDRSLFIHLSPGDYAVHVDHGIARFKGMKKLRLNEVEREYLALEYSGADMLYVPVDQADRVSRYSGSAGTPVISRLGTQEWARTKQRARESARHMAEELLDLYASRQVVPGFSFSPDTLWQQELEASFPYVETYDQAEAVVQVKTDMEKAAPMDRLICGDVGYGKTEIALRAAFKAVMDGKQVAIVVPTTVLAQQHFNTFRNRLGAFPIKVEMLSRFRSDREQKTVIEGLNEGTIDVCIGTHRLLQTDVGFKNLGLVIIDEEQRFGVAHKERLKQMRREVDVLTLTATPIPRTLHMAMVGVRDMSTLDTPPEERVPIRTFVAEFNEALIREAILREKERNGQVFMVHNRVQSMGKMAWRLAEIVPEVRIAVAHGQMEEEELECIMLDFYEGKVDVLLCTTIIESGLDIPNANTLIVNDADKLGLAQLYQLRGRIGRGGQRAYAYFLHAKGKRLTEAAEKRLQTIFEASELGAGFRIAMKDLEIRGAGNLLGPEQSGHIAAVGFELYCRLLSEAVAELKADRSDRSESTIDSSHGLPAVELPLSAYLPEQYIGDLSTRLSVYQRLARARTEAEVQHIEEELADRFGRPPKQVVDLLYVMRIRILCAAAGVESISSEKSQVVVRFVDSMLPDRHGLGPLPRGVKMGPTQLRLDLSQLRGNLQTVLYRTIATLRQLAGAAVASNTSETTATESLGPADLQCHP